MMVSQGEPDELRLTSKAILTLTLLQGNENITR